jgi:hypothetical protein
MGAAPASFRTLVAVITVAAVGAVLTVQAQAAPAPFDSQSASAIVNQARAAMAAAGSVSAVGRGSETASGMGKVEMSEQDYTATTSGLQQLKITSSYSSGAGLSASVMDVGGQLYVDANSPFWVGSAGVTAGQAVLLENRWIQIPSSSPLYANAAADLTLPSLLTDLFDAKTFHKGSVVSVDGVRAIAISYSNSGVDAGQAKCDIALGGKHLPVSSTIAGLTIRYESWGKTRPVSAPVGAVSISSVVPPAEATT